MKYAVFLRPQASYLPMTYIPTVVTTQASELATMEVLAGEVEELRAHAAERSVRHEHEGQLVNWVAASHDLLRAQVVVRVVQSLVYAS